jgi:hypothetical protein
LRQKAYTSSNELTLALTVVFYAFSTGNLFPVFPVFGIVFPDWLLPSDIGKMTLISNEGWQPYFW